MIWHPLILAVLVCDALSLLLVLSSVGVVFQVILNWDETSSSEGQLKLESRFEAALLQNMMAFALFSAATFLMIYSLSSVLHHAIPGAMCGTGVMEAMGSHGKRFLMTRLLTLTVFYIAFIFFQNSRSVPLGGKQVTTAKVLALILPVLVLSLIESFQAYQQIDFSAPVDCCSALLDRMNTSASASWIGAEQWPPALTSWGSPCCALALTGIWTFFKKARWTLIPTVVLWILCSYALLIHHLLPYHYGVLEHHCHWCVFDAKYHFQGYVVFGSMLYVLWVILRVLLQEKIWCKTQPVKHLLYPLMAFYVFSSWPALWWYLTSGTWIQ